MGIQQALSFVSSIRKGAIERICHSVESEFSQTLVKGWVLVLVKKLVLILILAATFFCSALAVTQCGCVFKWRLVVNLQRIVNIKSLKRFLYRNPFTILHIFFKTIFLLFSTTSSFITT
jgi:hypothetical protein